MKKKSAVLFLVSFFVVSILLAGCGNNAQTASAAGNTIKVGWMGPLTGDQTIWGQCELNTVKMLFNEINAKGGVLGKNLEVIGYDTKGDPQEAVNIARKLTTQDKVVAILGPNASGDAIPIAPVLEQAKVANIATAATNPKVTVIDGRVKPYNFRVCFIDPYQGAVAAGYAADVLKAKKAAVLYDVRDDYSQGLTQYFEEFFIEKGGVIVAKEGFKTGDIDFRPQLSNIKAANPDIIFMPYFFTEVALSANQARELGITATLIGGDGWPSEQLISMAKEAVEGSYFISHLNYDDPDISDIKKRYKEKYGKDAEANAYLVHDAVLMLCDALERAGEADSEKVAKALETTDIKGITGRIIIGKYSHNPEGKDAAIIKIVNGKYVFQQKFAVK